jgi:UDP-GlcNAc3NAcA epimerase
MNPISMHVLSIVGARPQFVKAAMVTRAVVDRGGIHHKLIHTGQHYDARMSDVFFEELRMPAPDFHLEVGSGSHAAQTGEMMNRLEPVLIAEKPDWVVLYGDTNSTLAGAIVAAKLGLRVAHVEAGLRSFNRRMPEEINRIIADRLGDILLCPTAEAMKNLAEEGLDKRAIITGDVMYDAFLICSGIAEQRGGPLAVAWRAGEFALATLHRAENTDDTVRLRAILEGLEQIAESICPLVLPLHPRTRKVLDAINWTPRAITMIAPVSYLEMLLLEGRARMILTDSGGVQKEAYFAKVPCLTLRDETEWVETLANGCNVLTGAETEKIVAGARNAHLAGPWTAVYGDGRAGGKTLEALQRG